MLIKVLIRYAIKVILLSEIKDTHIVQLKTTVCHQVAQLVQSHSTQLLETTVFEVVIWTKYGAKHTRSDLQPAVVTLKRFVRHSGCVLHWEGHSEDWSLHAFMVMMEEDICRIHRETQCFLKSLLWFSPLAWIHIYALSIHSFTLLFPHEFIFKRTH